jgi:phospholipid/cholesterol/gamma-HCH transport system substrate-binding protein
MERDTHYFVVGLFVIVTAVAGFFFGSLFYEKPYIATTAYDVHFDIPVAGLAQGSEVRYMGIKVGEVSRVSLLPQAPVRVAVRVALETGTPVNTATVAILRQQGLTGVPFVSLEQDEARKAEPLVVAAGAELPVIPSKLVGMDALMQQLPDLEQRLATVLESANKVLDDENRKQFAALLKNLNDASASLPELIKHLNQASASLPEMMKNLGNTSRKLGDLSGQMDSAVQQIDKLAKDIDRVVVNNEPNINGLLGEGSENLKQLLEESRKTAVSIRQLSDKLGQNPSQIIYQPAPQGTELPR